MWNRCPGDQVAANSAAGKVVPETTGAAMTRRLLNFVTALSLLLCVAAATLWVRSYFVEDLLEVGGNDRSLLLQSINGSFVTVGTWGEFQPSPLRFDWVREPTTDDRALVDN